MDTRTQSAFRFFHESAGYVVGRRAVCALNLAKAEAKAGRDGWRFRWVEDQDADNSWMTDRERQRPHEAFGCILERRCTTCGNWEVLASLWGIFDPSEDYRRVVQAELASEAAQAEGSR